MCYQDIGEVKLFRGGAPKHADQIHDLVKSWSNKVQVWSKKRV